MAYSVERRTLDLRMVGGARFGGYTPGGSSNRSSVMITTVRPQELYGHPKGLYVCFFTEMWERFSFYGMKTLLFFYITKYHLFTDEAGYLLLGTYGGLAYALPVAGGLLADRYLGLRKAVVLGGILLCLGHFGMALEGERARLMDGTVMRDATAVQTFYFSLALIIVGVGFLKPNISTLVGRVYPENDPRRDSGFTWFYMGINAGAFVSSLVCGYLGEVYGWSYGFGAAGIGMLIGLSVFLRGQRHFLGRAEPPQPLRLRQRVLPGLNLEWTIYAGSGLGVLAVWQILQMKLAFLAASGLTATEIVALVLALALGGWFVWYTAARCSIHERAQMWTLMILIAVSTVFWGLYEQTYGSWNAFADRVMNRDALGTTWTAGQLTALGAFFILALSPFFAWLWPFLDKRGLNPGAPAKFAWGLVCAGLAMGVLAYAAAHPAANGKAGFWWLVLAYFVLEVGEMVLSPIGLAAVTTLSVGRVVSLMMGVWFLASAFGEMLAGRLGSLAAIEDTGAALNITAALATYGGLFTLLMWIGLGAGALLLATVPWIRRHDGRAASHA
ncbi:MAG: peptide MFS transporter [Nevskiales bacterium]|nr:peptide MFS transporter [Nevskiales bacterium]